MLKEPPAKPRQVGAYELLERIGAGGMSTVYRARDTRSNATVAVKIASRQVIGNPQLSRRFELEYALVRPLDHPNLVKVLDHGVADKLPYLVMEFADGPSLEQHLKKHPRLAEHEAIAITLQVAEALDYLHGQKIIHRDVKPGNILLTAYGDAKLADLGLIKDLDSLTPLTKSRMSVGTTQFAAPEQFDDARSADAASDVYSLAATLYVMVTGEYPFGAAGGIQGLQRKLANQFETPVSKRPDLRDSVDAAIRLGLHAEPLKRPPLCLFSALLTGEKKIPATTVLPGTQTIRPQTPTKADRRASVRYEVTIEASCRNTGNPHNSRWDVTILDFSSTGLCVRGQRRFEVGSFLEITFARKLGGSLTNQLVRVRWLKSSEANTWVFGCEFVNPMPADDLNSIFADRMDLTSVVQR